MTVHISNCLDRKNDTKRCRIINSFVSFYEARAIGSKITPSDKTGVAGVRSGVRSAVRLPTPSPAANIPKLSMHLPPSRVAASDCIPSAN